MEGVETVMKIDDQEKYNAARDAQGKASKVYKSRTLLPENISKRGFDVIPEHSLKFKGGISTTVPLPQS